MSKNNWAGLRRLKETYLTELIKQNVLIKFDRFGQSDKAWFIEVNGKKYSFPKSKTILFHNNNTIQVPKWIADQKMQGDSEDIDF